MLYANGKHVLYDEKIINLKITRNHIEVAELHPENLTRPPYLKNAFAFSILISKVFSRFSFSF